MPLTHYSQSTLTGADRVARVRRRAHVAAGRATRVAVAEQKNLRASAIAFARICRITLMPVLGESWNSAWIPAGWKRQTLSVPRSIEDLIELFEDLHQFLTEHSDLENVRNEVTAANVQSHLDRLVAVTQEISAARTAQRQARIARVEAEAALMDQARGLVSELDLILPENDGRWIEFISEVPGDEQRPEAVEALVVGSEVPGEIDAEWEASARAERYLVEVLVVGTDSEFRRATTVRDTNVTLTAFPPGVAVKVRIVAANAAGEAAPSDEETVTVRALAQAA